MGRSIVSQRSRKLDERSVMPTSKELFVLRRLVNRLLDLAPQLLARDLQTKHADYLGNMICFISRKLIEHTRSILVLTDEHLDRDAALIARTMLESLALLKWAEGD